MIKNKKIWLIVVPLFLLALYWAAEKFAKDKASKQEKVVAKLGNTSYWTCPMHPQVHMDHEGECPICHMKLVKVEQTQEKINQQRQGEKRSDVSTTQNQLEILGVQKHKVEKMDLKALIPVSGRFISNSSVAFQIYEQDLRYVRSGLSFKGEASIASDEPINGTISSVDSIIDPTSRTVRVVGNIRSGSRNVVSESTFRGEIEIALKDKIAIPESSVLHTGQGDLVYVFIDATKVTPKLVKLGIKTEGFYEVLSGLQVDDAISSGPNFLIDSEAKIRGAND